MDQSVSPPPDEQADETEFATVASAATVEAAKQKALEQLRKVVPYVREDDVEFIVVDEGGQGGFLGMGKSQPRVEARVLPGATDAVGGDVVDADEALAEARRLRHAGHRRAWASTSTSRSRRPATPWWPTSPETTLAC